VSGVGVVWVERGKVVVEVSVLWVSLVLLVDRWERGLVIVVPRAICVLRVVVTES